MRSRYRIVDQDGLYFLTCTVVDWLSIFQSRPYFEIVTNSLAFCRANKGMRLYAYVIMEDRLHLIAGPPDLSGVLRAFKGFTAREIITLAGASGRTGLLNELAARKQRYKDASQHQVWQEGSHPQIIRDDNTLNQKIEYNHNNPVRRGYVDAPEHWRCSSARNYLTCPHFMYQL